MGDDDIDGARLWTLPFQQLEALIETDRVSDPTSRCGRKDHELRRFVSTLFCLSIFSAMLFGCSPTKPAESDSLPDNSNIDRDAKEILAISQEMSLNHRLNPSDKRFLESHMRDRSKGIPAAWQVLNSAMTQKLYTWDEFLVAVKSNLKSLEGDDAILFLDHFMAGISALGRPGETPQDVRKTILSGRADTIPSDEKNWVREWLGSPDFRENTFAAALLVSKSRIATQDRDWAVTELRKIQKATSQIKKDSPETIKARVSFWSLVEEVVALKASAKPQ